MLLLNDTDHFGIAVLYQITNLLVPTWHVPSTTRSPRSEMEEKNLLPPIVAQRDSLTGFNVRENKITVRIANLGAVIVCRKRRGADSEQQRCDWILHLASTFELDAASSAE